MNINKFTYLHIVLYCLFTFIFSFQEQKSLLFKQQDTIFSIPSSKEDKHSCCKKNCTCFCHNSTSLYVMNTKENVLEKKSIQFSEKSISIYKIHYNFNYFHSVWKPPQFII